MKLLMTIILYSFLVACGGGGGSDPAPSDDTGGSSGGDGNTTTNPPVDTLLWSDPIVYASTSREKEIHGYDLEATTDGRAMIAWLTTHEDIAGFPLDLSSRTFTPDNLWGAEEVAQSFGETSGSLSLSADGHAVFERDERKMATYAPERGWVVTERAFRDECCDGIPLSSGSPDTIAYLGDLFRTTLKYMTVDANGTVAKEEITHPFPEMHQSRRSDIPYFADASGAITAIGQSYVIEEIPPRPGDTPLSYVRTILWERTYSDGAWSEPLEIYRSEDLKRGTDGYIIALHTHISPNGSIAISWIEHYTTDTTVADARSHRTRLVTRVGGTWSTRSHPNSQTGSGLREITMDNHGRTMLRFSGGQADGVFVGNSTLLYDGDWHFEEHNYIRENGLRGTQKDIALHTTPDGTRLYISRPLGDRGIIIHWFTPENGWHDLQWYADDQSAISIKTALSDAGLAFLAGERSRRELINGTSVSFTDYWVSTGAAPE